jgi:hypothetical protein
LSDVVISLIVVINLAGVTIEVEMGVGCFY